MNTINSLNQEKNNLEKKDETFNTKASNVKPSSWNRYKSPNTKSSNVKSSTVKPLVTKSSNWNREKKSGFANSQKKKKRFNYYWSQSLKSLTNRKLKKSRKPRKSLQYLLVLKKFKNVIDYKKINLLRPFLLKNAKIRPRRKTRISVQKQHAIAKAIRKARDLKLIPFMIDVIL